MSRIFSFERELYATLDLMPLAVRRKLDLAGWKLSLDGWRAMSLADRRALVEAEVGDDATVSSFTKALQDAAARAHTQKLRPVDVPRPPPWRASEVPAPLRSALAAAGASLGDEAWAGLDDEARYVLLHLAERGSAAHTERLLVALAELGHPASRPV